MPIVAIPALMRSLTNGEDSVTISGTTIREVIDNLEIRYQEQKKSFVKGTVSIPVSVSTSMVFLPGEPCTNVLTQMQNSTFFLPLVVVSYNTKLT